MNDKPAIARSTISPMHRGPSTIGSHILAAAAAQAARGVPITPLSKPQELPEYLRMPPLSPISPLPYVLNSRKSTGQHLPSVYIGRGSPYGNPFVIGKDGTRDEVCEKFRRHFIDSIVHAPGYKGRLLLVETVKALRGQHLRCYCHPQRCHGHWLRDFVNADDPIAFIRKEANRL